MHSFYRRAENPSFSMYGKVHSQCDCTIEFYLLHNVRSEQVILGQVGYFCDEKSSYVSGSGSYTNKPKSKVYMCCFCREKACLLM